MSELIFISSPYSHKDKSIVEDRVLKVSAFSAKLVAEGKVVISPIAYGHTLLSFRKMPSDWKFWKNYCETFIAKCDKMIVLMLDGWKDSDGIKGEIEFATKLNIPIEYVEYNINHSFTQNKKSSSVSTEYESLLAEYDEMRREILNIIDYGSDNDSPIQAFEKEWATDGETLVCSISDKLEVNEDNLIYTISSLSAAGEKMYMGEDNGSFFFMAYPTYEDDWSDTSLIVLDSSKRRMDIDINDLLDF